MEDHDGAILLEDRAKGGARVSLVLYHAVTPSEETTHGPADGA